MFETHTSLEGILPSHIKASGVCIKVSAPGKVILHGEHSVVYGKLAVAAALELRTTAHLVEIETSNSLIVDFPIEFSFSYNLQEINNILDKPLPVDDPKNFNWEYPEKICHEELLDQADKFIKFSIGNKMLSSQQMSSHRAVFYLIFGILGSVDIRLSSVFIHVATQLKIGAGTGSSASFLVTLSALLLQYVKINKTSSNFSKLGYKPSSWKVNLKEFNEKELSIICNWAFNAERIIHGTPSGIDNTVCTYGSVVEFRKGTSPKMIPIKATIQILLINSKVQRETKTLVAKVSQIRHKFPNAVDNILKAIEEIAVMAVDKLGALSAEEDGMTENLKNETIRIYADLGALISMNQNLLASLDVTHPRLDEIMGILSEYGLHGKLTGAGGGGYAIALVPPFFNQILLENVQKVLISKGFGVSCVIIGGKGVIIE